jgi:mono/diheme cytochrome c family protein
MPSAVAVSLASVVLAIGAAACSRNELRPPSAEATYAVHCASCHGRRGAGDGPVAVTLRVPPPDLTTLSQRNGGVFPIERVASYIDGRALPPAHGTREMPVWGTVFDVTGRLIETAGDSELRIQALIEYLQRLQVRAEFVVPATSPQMRI